MSDRKHPVNSCLKLGCAAYDKLSAEKQAQAERIAELEKSLAEYGRHGRTSDSVMCEREKHGDYPCTCGFDQALKGGE